MSTLKIPSVWEKAENNDCKYAYEDGWYDGRDFASMTGSICDSPEEFGEWLRWLMTERNLTATDLGKMAGISTVAICKWARCEQLPQLSTIVVLLNALGYKLWILEDK